MLSVLAHERVKRSSIGWYVLLSGLLHLLAVGALTLPVLFSDVSRLPKQSAPVRVSFIHPVKSEEPQKAEAFAEASSRAQMPDASQAEGAQATESILPAEPLTRAEPPKPPAIQLQEQPLAPAPSPPAEATPSSAPQATPKRAPAPAARETTANRTPPTRGQPQRTVREQPKLQRFASLPESTGRIPLPNAPLPRAPQAPAEGESAPETEARQGWLFGRIPVPSGDDLERYAKLRADDQRSSGGNAVSLNTRELKYISYFAHIKRKIERMWGYPAEAIATGMHGQLHLKFVLQRNGRVKTVELLRSSGYKVLDKEAWDAVINAGPFDPFPPLIQDDELHITARFTYEMDTSLRRMMVR
ncbi:MAG: TonB family protein [Nitrospinae bacterium]|nr:TonB family protein [Nitrospinota bacterium]